LQIHPGKTLKTDLVAKRDFRGIPPTLWYVFVELYGRDKGQELCRYTMNAYDPPLVSTTGLVNSSLPFLFPLIRPNSLY
jgi:hypothetical protein